MNSTDKAYLRDQFIFDFIDSSCKLPASNEYQLSDYDDAIQEHKNLLSDAISFEYNKTASINSLMELLNTAPKNETIVNNLIKAWHFINDDRYTNIICGISGGSDSDIVLDICCRCDVKHKIKYFFCDTGIEYKATRNHLDYLEQKYGISIKRYPAWKYGKSIVQSCLEYGQPFISKLVSQFMHRLQNYSFKWEDRPYEELVKEYPNCQSALKWWCCNNGETSQFNITRNKLLKEFIIQNPPKFKISDKCCQYAKKNIIHKAILSENAQLNINGVRKAEGGIRATAYKNCFDDTNNIANYRPIFWYTNSDKKEYSEHYGVIHSDCYTEYGLLRTGCVGCPYGRKLDYELQVLQMYEPGLYKAVSTIFKDSYEYTKQYHKFVKDNSKQEKHISDDNI